MTALELKVYDIFKVKLGEKEAEAVMEFIDAKTKESVSDAKELFITAKDKETLLTVATAKDLFATKEDLAKLETGMHREFGTLMRWIIGLFIPLYLSIIGLFVTILLKK